MIDFFEKTAVNPDSTTLGNSSDNEKRHADQEMLQFTEDMIVVVPSNNDERVYRFGYLEILDETIQEIKTGVVARPDRECEMKVDIAAFISDSYMEGRDKLKAYKRIAEVNSFASRDQLISELEQVYGKIDLPLENLINVALLKNLASRQDVSRIIINKNGACANFYDAEVFKNEALMRAVADHSGSVILTNTIPPTLIFEVNHTTAEQKLAKLIEFFATVG